MNLPHIVNYHRDSGNYPPRLNLRINLRKAVFWEFAERFGRKQQFAEILVKK